MRYVCCWTHNRASPWKELTAHAAQCFAKQRIYFMCERVEKSFQMLLVGFFFVVVISLKIVLLHKFMCAMFVAHSLTYIFILTIHRNKRENTYTAVDVSNTYKIDMRTTVHGNECFLLEYELQKQNVWLVFGWLSLFLSFCWFSISKFHWMGLFRCTIYIQYTDIHTRISMLCELKKKITFDFGLAAMLVFSPSTKMFSLPT